MAIAVLIEFAKCVDGSLAFGVCSKCFSACPLVSLFGSFVSSIGAFSFLSHLSIRPFQVAVQLETQELLMLDSFALGFDPLALGFGALGFSLGTLPLAFRTFVLRLGTLMFLFEAFPHFCEFVGEFSNA